MKVLTHKEKIELNKKGVLWHGTTVENAKKVFNQGSFKAFTSVSPFIVKQADSIKFFTLLDQSF